MTRYLCTVCLRTLHALSSPAEEDIRERLRSHIELKRSEQIHVGFPFMVGELTQTLVHHCKYHHMPRLARHLGRLLGERFAELRTKTDVIVAVPLHRTRISERGYNQSEEIARGLAAQWGIRQLPRKSVRRVRPTKSQTTLSVEERLQNVREAFAIDDRAVEAIKGKRVLIVDDVLTTGSTITSFGAAVAGGSPRSITYLTFAAAK